MSAKARMERNSAIIAEFDGYNMYLLARKHGISERMVRYILTGK